MAIIIGGGPAGLFAGENIGDCTILEEHADIGIPEQCGGLISRSGLEELNVVDKSYTLNEIHGADFHSPNHHFSIDKNETVAYVVSRSKFDQYLASRAENQGCRIETNSKVKTITKKSGKWTVKTDSDTYSDEKLILSCGSNFNLISQAGLDHYQPENLLKCIQADCKLDTDAGRVSVHFSNTLAKGFFAWTIPTGSSVRVGIGSFGNALDNFNTFTKKLGVTPETKFADILPIRGPLSRTEGDNVYLLGDSAGQVKPTTGGGVVTGMKAARILADCIRNDKSYETTWRASLQKDFEIGLMISSFISKLSDPQFDQLFEILNKEDAASLLTEYGHMDRPSTLFKSDKLLRIISQISGLGSDTQEAQS